MLQSDLRGKVALITGVTKGIGRALTLALYQAGVRIAGCALDKEELQKLQEDLAECYFAPADITHHPTFQGFFDSVVEAFGVPDILIANAGVTDEDHHLIADLPLRSGDMS